jgi:transcription elongation factor SPT6
VRVAPEAYYLFDAAAVGVPELCDAFKVRYVVYHLNLITFCIPYAQASP